MYQLIIKPLVDKLVAIQLLVLGSPILLVTMMSLAIVNQGKVWFIQTRPGHRGKIFKIIKFRTMTDERDANGELLPDKMRITTIGNIVRNLSIDELPQLINVLKGDMSLIGPRPLLEEYLPLYNPSQQRRHLVKPGITGWAQVNGRNSITWRQKFELDTWYVDHISFLLDCKIVWLTLMKVFMREGVDSSKNETMRKFKGNPADQANL